MIGLAAFLRRAAVGVTPEVDWAAMPWSRARPALSWLGLASGPPLPLEGAVGLEGEDAAVLCAAVVSAFNGPDGELVWSSYLVESAIDAIAFAVAGVPEPLLRAAWDMVGARPLDRNTYEFCRALGATLQMSGPFDGQWDLRWLGEGDNPSQACLRCCSVGLRRELWDVELERRTMRVLAPYPFAF